MVVQAAESDRAVAMVAKLWDGGFEKTLNTHSPVAPFPEGEKEPEVEDPECSVFCQVTSRWAFIHSLDRLICVDNWLRLRM